MAKTFDKIIKIQRLCEKTETWKDMYTVHSAVNRTAGSTEYNSAGAARAKRSLTFEMRYFSKLEDVANNTESYRIVYNGINYNITDYDDFMQQHRTVKLMGVSY